MSLGKLGSDTCLVRCFYENEGSVMLWEQQSRYSLYPDRKNRDARYYRVYEQRFVQNIDRPIV